MGMISHCSLLLPLLLLDHASGQQCKTKTLDFIIVDGQTTHAAIEDDIREELASLGITVNARFLAKDDFNTAMTSGDFDMVFSETWGSPYDPVASMTGWMSNNEAHYSAMSGVTGANSRQNIFDAFTAVLAQQNAAQAETQWQDLHNMVHQSAVNLPLWGTRIPAVLNDRLSGYVPGYQQFDYPVWNIQVDSGSTTVTVAPGAQSGLFNTIGRLDPHTYRPNEFFANNWVYEGLVSYGANGAILPSLAASWTTTSNSVTFTLRTGVTFTDGAAWDCSVAKLNFDHVLAANMRTTDWHGWYQLPLTIQNWECDSNGKFVVTTTSPTAQLLQDLTYIRPLRMLSPNSFASGPSSSPITENSCHVGWSPIEGDGPTITCAGINASAPVGTGPFKFVSRTQAQDGTDTVDSEVVFDRNDNWWGNAVYGTPGIATLVIKRYTTPSAVKSALNAGSLDMVLGDGVLTPSDLNSYMSNSGFNVYFSEQIGSSIIILNSARMDLSLRKAVIHGVDKGTIITRELAGLYDPIDRLFSRDTQFSDVELTPRWDYDYEKAQMIQCPVSSSSSSDEDNREALALGLGLSLGLGIPLFLAIGAAFIFWTRSAKAEGDLKRALANSGEKTGDAAPPAPQTVGAV